MKGRSFSRDAVLSIALAAAGYLVARPPYAIEELTPGIPRDESRQARAGTSQAASWEEPADELHDAISSGACAPSAEHAHPPTTPSDFARRLGAAALGIPQDSARSRTLAAPSARGPLGVRGEDSSSPSAGKAAQGSTTPREGRHHHEAGAARDFFAAASHSGSDPSRPPDVLAGAAPAEPSARNAGFLSAGAHAGGVDLRSPHQRAASLFEPPRGRTLVHRRSSPRGRSRARRFRPPRLSALLKGKALRPPPASLRPPKDLLELPARRPLLDAAGRVVPKPASRLQAIEAIAPDGLPKDRRRERHWDEESWHDRRAHGLARDEGWLWLEKDASRWWGLVGTTPVVRHQNLWWLRRHGMWLVLHQGEPWAWHHFPQWRSDGLVHLETGTQIVYSQDLSRAAVISPGQGAVVYDALSGSEIGAIPEDCMPPNRLPKPPSSLTLP